ncbi:MAG: VCBS repeat-containing protein, partial [Actinomycetes bacterium]
PFAVTVGDLDGDGKLDLVAANEDDDTVSVLFGHGDGTFAAKTDFATGINPRSVAVGDFNGDGKPDLATADYRNAANTVSILLNDGTGAFPSHVEYATGSAPFAVTVGDLDGDGKLDLVAANVGGAFAADRAGQRRINRPFDAGVGGVSVLLGNGNGTFQGKIDYPAGLASSVAIGDFNGDSKPDLATANPYNYGVAVLLYTQMPKGTMTIDEGAAATKARLVHIDSTASYATEMRLRDAGGTWSAWQPYAAQTSWTLPAGDGAKTVEVQYRNSDGDSAVVSAAILLDTHGPRTQGAKVVAQRGKRVTFRIRIKDAKPGSPTTSTDPATPVTIKIRNLRGVLLRTITATAPFATNVQVKLTWKKCNLRAGRYTYKVYAYDLAGNWSARTQFNTFIVR